jgi:serine/threonine protein kinase
VKRKVDHLSYALKRVDVSELSNRELANALNEIRVLASFNHPRIVSRLRDVSW